MGKKAKQQGFSLVELMVVVAIVGILATAAVVTLRSGSGRAAARNFVADAQRAKMEAVKRNANVGIVVNSLVCPGLPAAVPSPGGGYTIFVDNGPSNNALDAGEFVIANVAMPRDVAICANTFAANPRFNPKGLLIDNFGLNGNSGTVTFNTNRNISFTVNLSVAGGVRLQ